jgi:hypothetical protein
MRAAIIPLAALVVAAPAAAQQPTDAERRAAMIATVEDMASGGMVTVSRPGAWAVRPTYAEVQAAKPKGVVENGYVTVRCAALPDGALKDCIVTWEEPKGLGFGAAGLALAPRFRLTPEMAQIAATPLGGAAFMLHWEGKGGPCYPPNCNSVPPPPPPPGGWKAPAGTP